MTLIATLALLSGPAHAGGIGITGLAGMHSEKVYFYDSESNQYADSQLRPTVGFGLEALLGDRDDRLMGLMKFYFISDSQPTADRVDRPSGVEGPFSTPLDEDFTQRPVGMFLAGLQWGLWGDPTGFQLNLTTSLGAGALTPDTTEFMVAEIGLGAHYVINKKFVLHGEALYHLRYRKSIRPGGGVNVGVRYYFD